MNNSHPGIQNLITGVLFFLTAVIGITALALPFIMPSGSFETEVSWNGIPASGTPLLAALLIGLCLAVLLVELQGQAAGSKTVAVLGILVAATSILRFIEVAIPGPGGFSPIFVPIILAGYVFGPRFGFLMGAMTLFVSAIMTAGIGPWLPYQMFTAGWIGMTAGWLPHPKNHRWELILLAAFGFVWGFAYGAIMNLSTWPYLVGDPSLTWSSGEGLAGSLTRYATYYLLTSLVWDASAAIGNVLLIAALGLPATRALSRFKGRMRFQVQVA
jgi:energy-coupling factor transport system substrate-specific component